MANPRVIWLPKFDASADYIVVKPLNPIAGRKYQQDEEFDKSSVDGPRLRRLYESRVIAAVRSEAEQQRLDQDNRRQSKGKPMSFGYSGDSEPRKAQMAPYVPKAMQSAPQTGASQSDVVRPALQPSSDSPKDELSVRHTGAGKYRVFLGDEPMTDAMLKDEAEAELAKLGG